MPSVPKPSQRRLERSNDSGDIPLTDEDWEAAKARRKAKKRQRYTGASQEIREGVLLRAGYHCEICGGTLQTTFGFSIHHRMPRGMGGSKSPYTNAPSNLMAVCGSGVTGCHGYIENNREEAYLKGWLVHRGANPATVPVVIVHGQHVLLTDECSYDFERGLG